MAETRRTLAAILALLADNTAGDISPEDLRDAIVSTFAIHGELRTIAGASGQTIGTSYSKVNQWTSSGPASGITSDHATNKRLTATVDGVYLVVASIAFSGTASVDYTLGVQKNASGAQEAALGTFVSLDSVVLNGTAHISGIVTLSATDYLELWCKASAGSSSFLVTQGSLLIQKIG